MSRFSQIVPQNPQELERFYLDAINKLKGTDTTLADEEQKSITTTNGRITDLSRVVTDLSRDVRAMRVKQYSRQTQDIRMIRAQLTRIEARLKDIEGQL